jgi:glycosyltransferase involved in cell wall biosynthesis
MIIDPWATGNVSLYLNGLSSGISNQVDLTLFTNCDYKNSSNKNYKVNPIFFKMSQNMKDSKLRKIIRGIEYIQAYNNIFRELKNNKYDVVHIQWLLIYKADILFLKKLRKYCNNIVYTAHNVVPHVKGDRYIKDLETIYGLVDKIILHGEGIKKEFIDLFEKYKNKVIIQRHGTYLNQNIGFDVEKVDENIINKTKDYDKVFIFFGHMFFNKGVDRLVHIWLQNFKNTNNLLIIAGKKNGEYKALDKLEPEMGRCENLLYINKYVEDNLLNFLINNSDIILLPYRHASMSGVIFTAAEFKKTVLCTNTGAISEYVVNNDNSFVVNDEDAEFYNALKYISDDVSKETLKEMGERLNSYIINQYSWSNIGNNLIYDAYKLNE